jgi:hypothetical protein
MPNVLSSAGIRELEAVLNKHGITCCLLFYQGAGDQMESSMIVSGDEGVRAETADILYMYGVTIGATVMGRENAKKLIDSMDQLKFGENQLIIDNEN